MGTCTTFTCRAGPDGGACKLCYCVLSIDIGTNTQTFSLLVEIGIRLQNRKPLTVHSSITPKRNNSKMRGTPCRDLTYRGTWTSYFTVGPVKSFNYKLHYGPELDLDNCASGGKDDLH